MYFHVAQEVLVVLGICDVCLVVSLGEVSPRASGSSFLSLKVLFPVAHVFMVFVLKRRLLQEGEALRSLSDEINCIPMCKQSGNTLQVDFSMLQCQSPPKAEKWCRENCRKAFKNILDIFGRFAPCAKNVGNILTVFDVF